MTPAAVVDPRRALAVAARPPDDVSTSVGKALAILDAFAPSGRALGVSELARRTGVAKSTAHRLLHVLEAYGYVEREDDRWILGNHIFMLGNLPSCRPQSLRERARPFLQDLYELTHETVHLAVLDGLRVLYLDKIHGHDGTSTPSVVGATAPAHCTAVGKAILARSDDALVERVIAAGLPQLTPRTITSVERLRIELAAIRRQGYALDCGESRVGLTCVAAPVLSGGLATAAISVSGKASRFHPETVACAVRQAALSVGRT